MSTRPRTKPRSAKSPAGASITIPERVWTVAGELDGSLLDRVVRTELSVGAAPGSEASWGDVRRLIRAGHVLVDGAIITEAECPVGANAEVRIAARPSEFKKVTAHVKRESTESRQLLLYVDSQLVVVDKPAGISTEPYDENEKDTLDKRVGRALARDGGRAKLLTVHRLDKETTGVIVFARTHAALEKLKSQFRFKTTNRKYVALAHGAAKSRRIESNLVKDRGDGLRGSTDNPRLGRNAITDVTVLEHLGPVSYIACKLGTGRTHQIRIHLSETGNPLLGDRVYTRGYQGQVLEAPRVMLHAAELAFDHPTDNRRLEFKSPMPRDFTEVLEHYKSRAPKNG